MGAAAKQSSVDKEKRRIDILNLPVSSWDAFEFEIQRSRIGYHVQTGGQGFGHCTDSIYIRNKSMQPINNAIADRKREKLKIKSTKTKLDNNRKKRRIYKHQLFEWKLVPVSR